MRLHLRIIGSAEGLILDLTEKLGISPKELVLDALAMYNLAVNEVKEHRRLGVLDPETREFTAIATPTLQALSAKVGSTDVEEGDTVKAANKAIGSA